MPRSYAVATEEDHVEVLKLLQTHSFNSTLFYHCRYAKSGRSSMLSAFLLDSSYESAPTSLVAADHLEWWYSIVGVSASAALPVFRVLNSWNIAAESRRLFSPEEV